MDLIEENYKEEFLNHNENYAAETSAEDPLSPDYSSTDAISGEPPVVARLGYQYQVEIPALISDTERLQLQNTSVDNVDRTDFNFCIGKGLSVPIIWVHHGPDHVGHVKEEICGASSCSDATIHNNVNAICDPISGFSLDTNSYQILDQDAKCKVEISDIPSDSISMPLCQTRENGVYIPLPGSCKASWSDSESQSFLLGLYIFGKNLVQVQRFVESKDMGDVLSFYYGKFYRSDAQRRWVECRKTRSRRCILGHRIFTGWRQQELLSRLQSGRSKDVQGSLLEITKAFNEGTATLEELIFTLKSMVGTEALVEAVGIGKGKQDLTGMILDPVRTNPAVSSRPEIPAGKACSSLTSGEIIKFLTGDFRLSKAKSNDLFWEAVWPRLLARGWHSEQPKDSLGSKNALVFLIPGIKKFSRKKLTKGNQYFDSVSDVLSNVASDPRLLELEVEEGKESSGVNDESQWKAETADMKVGRNGLSGNHRPCYLRPRIPNCNSDFMKFTVVDTSLAQGGAPSKVRELRSLPADVTSSYRRHRRAEETNSDSSTEQSSSGDSSSSSQGEADQSPSEDKKGRSNRKSALQGVQSSLPNHFVTDQKLYPPGNGHDVNGQCCELLVDKPSMKNAKGQFRRRIKPSELCSLAPAPKRHRLASCKSVGSSSHSFSVPSCSQLNKEEEHFRLEPLEINKEIAAEDRVSQEEGNGAVLSHEMYQPARTLIDLNLHPQDMDPEGPMDMEVEGNQYDSKPRGLLEVHQQLDDSLAHETNIVLPDEQQSMMNGRRHSTRNRPPTAKALEALACGFLSVRKERGTRTPRSGSLTSRSSRRARRNVEASLPPLVTHPNTMTQNVRRDEEYYRTTNHAVLFDNSHLLAEKEEAQELLGVL